MSDTFELLWTDYLEGELDASGIQSLQRQLSNDPGLVSRAADIYEVHRLIGQRHQPFFSDRFSTDIVRQIEAERNGFVSSITDSLAVRPGVDALTRLEAQVPGRKSTWAALGLLAGVVLALFVVGVIWFQFGPAEDPERVIKRQSPQDRDSGSHRFATLLLAERCEWVGDDTVGEGQRLSRQQLRLLSGVAVIRFDGGAEIVMTGETTLSLRSSGAAELLHGDVIVRASDGAEGFELLTPASPLVDLGTEFAVRVDRKGATDVHVIEGEVEYVDRDKPTVLSTGMSVRIRDRSLTATLGDFNSPRFEDVVKRANPRAQPHRMVAYEGFHYEEGLLPLEESTRGKGWAGPWRLRMKKERKHPVQDSTPEQLEIVHGQLNVVWPILGGRLGMLKLPAGGAYYVRPLKHSIDLDKDQVVYFSLMVRENEESGKRTRGERLRLTFRASQDYFREWVSFGHGSGFRPHVHTGPGVSHTGAFVLNPNQTSLWLGKIVARADGEDEIYFRVFGEEDELGYAEPATWHVVSRGARLDAHLDRVLLSTNGEAPRIVDELRIGPTWRSVAPIPEPQQK